MSASSTERVLIVEDEPSTRLGLTELVRTWGFTTDAAADGEEALQRITVFRPSIIISDLVMPRMGGSAMVFVMASLGLPGLGNFVGEILVLQGTYMVNVPIAILATLGFIFSTVYSLWLIQRAFYGPNRHNWKVPNLNARELAIMVVMIVALLYAVVATVQIGRGGTHGIPGARPLGTAVKAGGDPGWAG